MASIQASMFVAFAALGSVAGCATAPEPSAQAPESVSPKRPAQTVGTSQPTRASVDDLYRDPVAIDRREAERQVAALRQAIVLHQQFIERAEHDSQYAEAVKRSRDRIEDARATIDFLLAEPSPAP